MPVNYKAMAKKMLEESDVANARAAQLDAEDRARKKSLYQSQFSEKATVIEIGGGTKKVHKATVELMHKANINAMIKGRLKARLRMTRIKNKFEQKKAGHEDPVLVLEFGKYQLFWSIVFGLGTFSFIYELNVGSLLLDVYTNCIRPKCNTTENSTHIPFVHPTPVEQSFWAVSNFVFTIPGILAGYSLSSFKESKLILASAAAIIALSTFVEAFLTNFALIIMAKMVMSFGIGLSLLTGTVHILEITPKQYRSFSMAGLIATWGLCTSTLLGVGAIFRWGWTTIFLEGVLLMAATSPLVFLLSSPSALIRMGADNKTQTDVITTIVQHNMGQPPSDNKVVLLPNHPTPCLRDFINPIMMRNTVSLVTIVCSSTFLYSSLVHMAPILLSKRCESASDSTHTAPFTHRRANLGNLANHTCMPSFGYDIHLSLFLSSFSDWLVLPFVALLSAFLESVNTLRICTLVVPLMHVTLIFCFSDVLYSLLFSLYRGAVSAVIYSALVSGSELYKVHMLLPLFTILLSSMAGSALIAPAAAQIIGEMYGATVLLIYLTPFAVCSVVSTWFVDPDMKCFNKTTLDINCITDRHAGRGP